jgi:2-oxoglutarate dehydrogenase E2 component (dihydrolipoamide succinyltransferase)
MAIEVKVPLLPESVSDATISTWHKKAGDYVSRDENIVDLETDKVMLEVPAPIDGILKEIISPTGTTVQAQATIAVIEAVDAKESQGANNANNANNESAARKDKAVKQGSSSTEKSVQPEPLSATADKSIAADKPKQPLSPSVRRAVAQHDMDVSQITGTGKGGRITKENLMTSKTQTDNSAATTTAALTRTEKRVPMTRMRARIAERLLEVTQNTAMLTTFNEINMAPIMGIRQRYQDQFEKKYKTRLGFMSFFVRACVEALKRSPVVNASIDGNDVVYHGYYDIGVAVSTDRGLVVPVLRDADKMTMAEIEISITEAADKARSGKLSMEDMQGGTFTITNGGVFGSLMATPLLNSPQCAILGMHKIEERPVVDNGQIVIKPMMYVALSYDHRLIDGKESVTFLVTIKNLLEDPTRLILEV